MSKILGVTGPSGSGKSELCRCLAALGCGVIDCDRLARSVTKKGSEGLAALTAAFGSEILCADGRLNRRKLAKLAFAAPEHTRLLNEITHPRIIALVEERIARYRRQGRLIVLDAPLLFSGGLADRCDRIVVVTASEKHRLERLRRRDHSSEERLRARLNAYREPLDDPRAERFVNEGTAEQIDGFAREIYRQMNETVK